MLALVRRDLCRSLLERMKHVFGKGHGGINTHLRESGSVFGGVGGVVLG
jgi:hypothetical protein